MQNLKDFLGARCHAPAVMTLVSGTYILGIF